MRTNLDELLTQIKKSFQPVDYQNCPDIREKLLRGEREGIETLDSVNLAELPVMTQIYFFGRGGAEYYTLEIAEGQQVRMWRDTDSNALLGQINMIVSQSIDGEMKRGVIGRNYRTFMPYFKYDTSSGKKAVLPPDEIWIVGGLLGLFVKKPYE